MAWTEDNVALLRKYWAEGQSASQIARQLGGMTRNAVIGKVHRLKLAERAIPSRPVRNPRVTLARTTRPTGQPAKPRLPRLVSTAPVREPPPPVDPFRCEDGKLFTIETIGGSQCRYTYGDPQDADFGFCGHKTSNKGTWCAAHRAIVYQPGETNAERRERQRRVATTERVHINGEHVRVAMKAAA